MRDPILRGSTSSVIEPTGLILPSGRAVGQGGGGKGKGGGGFSEDKNTNRSRAIVRLVDLLSEGPIFGLKNGSKSIYLNNTPLIAPDGRENFRGVSWEMRLGLVDQDPLRGFPVAENTVGVETEVKHGTGSVVRTYASESATLARVVLRFPGLYFQNTKKNKLENSNLEYTIEVRPEGGSYLMAFHVTLRDKKWMAPYEREHMVVLPESPTKTWDIRVTKITQDPDAQQYDPAAPDDSTFLSNGVIWASTGLVTERRLIYPDSAYIAMSFDAATFGNSLPERWYELLGRQVKVPMNYDPWSRTYAVEGPGVSGGMWDGVTFKLSWTNNPAWVCYDVLTATRYGCGLDESLMTITRFELYMIGQYCDELVPDGYGGYEPRYSLNAWINTADDAYKFLQRIVQTFRGMCYWAAGQVSLSADMPADPVKIVTNANVVEGDFNYEGASLKTMHTMVRVSYTEPNIFFQREVEVVDDPDRLALFGERILDIEAFGCTSRGEANRFGRWALDTEKTSTELVTYECALDQVDLRPGDIILIQDQWREGVRAGGRVVDAGADWILLDAIFDQTSSGYLLSTVKPDGTLQANMTITSFAGGDAEHTKVTVSTNFPTIPLVGSIWIISTDDVPARQFRVLAISEHKKGQARVTALFHDPEKFLRVEEGLALDSPPWTSQPPVTDPIPPPSAVDAVTTVYGEGVTTIVRVTASCTPARDPRIGGHQFRMTRDSDGIEYSKQVSDHTADFDNLPGGDYLVSARSVGVDGRTSEWVDREELLEVNSFRTPVPKITGVVAEGGVRQVLIKWDAPADRGDIRHFEVWRAASPLLDPELYGGELVDKTYSLQTTDGQRSVLLPGSTWWYWVRAVGLTGDIGPFSDYDQANIALVGADDLGDSIINYWNLNYTAISAVVTDELTIPFNASASVDDSILSVVVPASEGYKVAVVARLYTPNIDMASGLGLYGGGGGTDNPDEQLPLVVLDTAWVTGGSPVMVMDSGGKAGTFFTIQQRTLLGQAVASTVNLDIQTELQRIEACYPIFDYTNWSFPDPSSFSGTLYYSLRVDAPTGYEVSSDNLVFSSQVMINFSETFIISWDSGIGFPTTKIVTISQPGVPVYVREIGHTLVAQQQFSLPSTDININLKWPVQRYQVISSSQAVTAGIITGGQTSYGTVQTEPTALLESLGFYSSRHYVSGNLTQDWTNSHGSPGNGLDVVTAAGSIETSFNASVATATLGVNIGDYIATSTSTAYTDNPVTDFNYAISMSSGIRLSSLSFGANVKNRFSNPELSSYDTGNYYCAWAVQASPSVSLLTTGTFTKTGTGDGYAPPTENFTDFPLSSLAEMNGIAHTYGSLYELPYCVASGNFPFVVGRWSSSVPFYKSQFPGKLDTTALYTYGPSDPPNRYIDLSTAKAGGLKFLAQATLDA